MKADLVNIAALRRYLADKGFRHAADSIIIDCFMNQAAKGLEKRHVEKNKGF